MPEETLKQVVDRVKATIPAIGNAIVAKGGTVSAGDGLEDFAADIATIPSGGIEPAEPKDVNFYDYDGTCVYSYTADEFAELTAMPANPTHAGLTAQGWNWSLSDAKDYVADYGMLDIGQMYITSDGKTRIYISLVDELKSPYLKLYLNANSELDIDWGDGSTHSTFSAATADYIGERHVYATGGNYVIAITVVSGSFNLQSSSNSISTIISNNGSNSSSRDRYYVACIQKINIGSGVSTLFASFNSCVQMKSITIPNSITSFGYAALYGCVGLRHLALPNSVDSIGNNALRDNYALESISFPAGFISTGTDAIENARSLMIATLPDTMTSINGIVFNQCYALSSINIPLNATSVGAYAFQNCYSLNFIKFRPTTPPTISNINAWANISSDCYILVPLNTLDDYLNETNMPDDSVYLYLCYAKYASGVALPTTSTDGYTLTWYATKDDARAGTNPITVGNGKEVYAVGV